MNYGISQLAIIPMRAEPSERSEQVSQLLFGETYEITEWQEKWVKVITVYDAYEGWISRVQVSVLNYEDYLALQQSAVSLASWFATPVIKKSDGSLLYLPASSTLPFLEGNEAQINGETYQLTNTLETIDDLITTARSYLNSPYLWGGRTHFGIDCSGFTQAVFKLHGQFLKRDASMQAEQGKTVDFLTAAQPGDLAFFDNDEGCIVHVGIMLSNEEIIHASGRVKIDRIDDQGIYSEEMKKHTHKLRIIKRLSPTQPSPEGRAFE
ncbi:C40 family peptidase [Mucilaginibacter sp. Bleaf8]|uniref:C40 family peptidase n=1 Tax=Mucilaginibacter sp. Bleaf8 TaxID=2834430 RepID=UPI001BCFE2BB|nr:C40 family peptidase [Mucilaginibacter sp. Bleaf8]MBS7564994.1 C40 family peptidase [Mucilaginibacter sp. Bleaf8]